jgi:hypothetical protein
MAGPWNARTMRFCAARETEPVNLSNDSVAGQSITEQACDLAGALTVDPMLL